MESFLIAIIIILITGFAAVLYFFSQKFRQFEEKKDDTSLKLLSDSVQGMHTRLDNAAKFLGELNRELGHMTEIGRSMKDLQDFLRSPKLRGNIGEQILGEILAQFLPRQVYKTQFKFREGQTVDAIIKTEQGIIPVDAKFPMENFKKLAKAESDEIKKEAVRDFTRDVKKHIADISGKYILPQEGTVDFAVMYVPSEAIYYEIITKQEELANFAAENHILLVSPNGFYYFLRVILMGLEGQKISQASRKILETLKEISGDTKKFGQNLSVLGRHVTNAKNSMDMVSGDFDKLSKKIDDTKMLKPDSQKPAPKDAIEELEESFR